MINFIDTARKHILNFPGRKLDKKYIVFESDDWGSERIPSRESLKYLTSCGIDVYSNPFNYLDSLETVDDLSALFEVLVSFRDRQGNHPIITANSVTSNPDFIKIKASRFREYHYESILKTYSNKKECEKSYAMIKDGISTSIYHPQFHGREHLNINQWLIALQSGKESLLKAFETGIYALDLEAELAKETYFMAAFNGISHQEICGYGTIIKEGTSLFREIYGYMPHSFIAPCYRWHPSLEILLKENGIKYIQGLPIQYAIDKDGKDKKIYHYQGQRNDMGQIYFIRNCFFEPAINKKVNWIEDCLRRIKIIFFWGKPAIVGTHRLNFMGSLNEDNRKRNLKDFATLLKLILATWPDAEFIASDKLGELY